MVRGKIPALKQRLAYNCNKNSQQRARKYYTCS